MSKQFGWWVDLQKVALADPTGTKASWVHALPFGTFQHPLYGEMVFDQAKLTALAASVTNKIRGIDPDIDYDHKEDPAKGNQAAGWVKDAQVRTDGLYLYVEWTPDGAENLEAKRYRYFSADFADQWTDALGVTHKDVLLGGGITNRPYMKNLMPVNLSELKLHDQPEGGQKVDPKKLRESLGLAGDVSDDAVLAKLNELGKTVVDLTAQNTALSDDKTKLEAEVAKLKEKEPEVDPELKKLVDASPAVAKMLADLKAREEQISTLETAARLSEAERQLTELQTGKRFAITPVHRTKLRDLLVKLPKAGAVELHEFLKAVVEGTGLVDLSEVGYAGRKIEGGADATKRFNDAVKQLMEDNKDKGMTFGDAVERVAREQPALYDEHRKSTYIVEA